MAFQKNFEEKKIAEMKAGDNIQGMFFVRESELKLTTTNNKYMNFTLSDKTGDINAKLWDYDEQNAVRYAAGCIVKIKGLVKDWQGQMQLSVESIMKVLPDENVDVSELIPSAPFKGQDMYDFIAQTAETMKNTQLKAVVNEVLTEFKEKLLIYPAAKKNHHAVRCGLLYHTSTMLKMALAYCDVYPVLNRDLLITGVIIHDIGKTEEMEINESGLVSEYSTQGQLLGHIIQGLKIVDGICKKLGVDEEISMMLQHMILSHHYEPEYGSPKYPMFPEAEILHYLDISDARLYDMGQAKQSAEAGGFSEKIKSLEGRMIYRPEFEEN